MKEAHMDMVFSDRENTLLNEGLGRKRNLGGG